MRSMRRLQVVIPEFLRDDIRELIEGNYRIVCQVFELTGTLFQC
jgi:hypothetical protein